MNKASHYNYAYNKNLQPLAKQLRKKLTKAEACLWKYVLKAQQLSGYQFRKQRPVLHYIADFLCKELMLIVEVDGVTHDNKVALNKDKQRDNNLANAGFKVVRFTDEEVLNNIVGVKAELENIINEIENSTPLMPRQRGTKKDKG